MLPKGHSLQTPQGLYHSPHARYRKTHLPFGHKSRRLLAEAEPDLQILDKPVLRRPEPPKPPPAPEEKAEKKEEQVGGNRGGRNGSGATQTGPQRSGSRDNRPPRAQYNGSGRSQGQQRQGSGQQGSNGRGNGGQRPAQQAVNNQPRSQQRDGQQNGQSRQQETQASAPPAAATVSESKEAKPLPDPLSASSSPAVSQKKPEPKEEEVALMSKPSLRKPQPQAPAPPSDRSLTRTWSKNNREPRRQQPELRGSMLQAQQSSQSVDSSLAQEGGKLAERQEEEAAAAFEEEKEQEQEKQAAPEAPTEELQDPARVEDSVEGELPKRPQRRPDPPKTRSQALAPDWSSFSIDETSTRRHRRERHKAQRGTQQQQSQDDTDGNGLDNQPEKDGKVADLAQEEAPPEAPAASRSLDEAQSEGEAAILNAKPTRRQTPKEALPPRILRRQASGGRRGNENGHNAQQQQAGPRGEPKESRQRQPVNFNNQNQNQAASPEAQPQKQQSRKKDKGQARKQYEKPNIEKLRQSRYERRQQRQERNQAEALEQEEIFEVGAEGMLVQDLAEKLACNSGDILKVLFFKGIMAQVNQVLDKDMVKTVAEEYGVEVLDLEEAGLDTMAQKKASTDDEEDAGQLVARPPVVTVMGHVDHGKTSLLDFIRKTKIAAGEAGGITQAIGAYTCQVDSDDGKKAVTFIDTPGHEAFTAMRARGAKVTDIAIIVVACDDGVRPQTKEAIGHAKAAKVPIIVAVNKIDKDGANPERAKQEMSEAGLLPEEWGGDTPMVEISAKKGLGIDDLLETILLLAELEQLSANPTRAARGTVVEAHMHSRMGPMATLLVAAGTLRTGNVFHAGAAYGKVRLIKDSGNRTVEEAGPSVAALVVGLNSVPTAGDEFTVMDSEQEARKVAAAIEESQRLARLNEQAGGSMVTGVSFATLDPDESDGLQHLNVILKADASGSLEAVKGALLAMPQDRVTLRFLLTGTGPINSGDVQLANASQAQIISFNQEPSEAVIAQSKQCGVQMKSYKVIYELVDDVRDLMEGRLNTVEERTPLGEAQVRAVFGSGSRKVAGCMVTEGMLKKGCLVQIVRNRKQVHEGELTSLRRVKENINEISQGNECGVGVANFIEWREGDKIEAVEVHFKRQTLEEASKRELVSNLQSYEEDFDEDYN